MLTTGNCGEFTFTIIATIFAIITDPVINVIWNTYEAARDASPGEGCALTAAAAALAAAP